MHKMYSKVIFSFLIFGLLALTKINGYIVNNYTGKCNDIYVYLENQGKRENFYGCKLNDEGEVTELEIYNYCLEDEQLTAVLSYNTIETLHFSKLFVDWNIDDNDDKNLVIRFGCASLPSNYEVLSTLTNLKILDLSGVKNLDNNIITNIPKSVEQLLIGRVTFTQEMVDELSKLTNLNNLVLSETQISEELDFSKFENLKNLTSLEIRNNNMSNLNSPHIYTQGNLLKHCVTLKKLFIKNGIFDKNSLDSIGYLTELEELELETASFENDADFSSLKNLKNLTSMYMDCSESPINISPNFFYLTKLNKLTLTSCETTISTSLDNSLTWANLNNLEYLSVVFGGPTTFDIEYIGDIPSLKEVHLLYNNYFSIPESIGNLKNLEIFETSLNSFTSLPKSIGNLEKLKKLDLKFNKIASLPDEIGNLKSLENLDLSFNEITNIPSTLGNLENLETLSLNENLIDDYLPESLNTLPKLSEIFLGGNINIKGQTLSNPNLSFCRYSPPKEGYIYSLCEAPNATCKDFLESFPQCEVNNESFDNIEPSDDAEPSNDVEPSVDVEPSDDAELFDYDEMF